MPQALEEIIVYGGIREVARIKQELWGGGGGGAWQNLFLTSVCTQHTAQAQEEGDFFYSCSQQRLLGPRVPLVVGIVKPAAGEEEEEEGGDRGRGRGE